MWKLLFAAAIGLSSLSLVACGSGSEGAPEKPGVTIEPITAVSTPSPIPTATLPAELPTPIVVAIDGEVNNPTSGAACNRPNVLEGAAVIWNSQNICIVRYLNVGTIQAEAPFAKDLAEYSKFKAIGDKAVKALIQNEACDVDWGPPSSVDKSQVVREDLVVEGC